MLVPVPLQAGRDALAEVAVIVPGEAAGALAGHQVAIVAEGGIAAVYRLGIDISVLAEAVISLPESAVDIADGSGIPRGRGTLSMVKMC